ncbi:MAG: UDP-N-acetylmuramoyl-tripeptide--D-alanyl-D-alanine ligase [Bacteroidales bacterium]|jgi:UDP-N-acetylmuramoyl-tripeptide--D-alanyl-D-alanine ligase|nr:UDP-N-acetylmuramoyl-tripeptide--D-alanyl-D-alanine ligase [Bacteroidales bacterium]
MKTELLYKLFRESSGISTDSRTVIKGQIFFALWGENYNGNKFAAEALEKGASWAIIDDASFETEKTILVDDCLLELQALATYYRREMKTSVLAITGTNGKTTTKELLAVILSKKFKVHATSGNLNNQIGVPLTILSAPEVTEMLIVELGASHVGEIRILCLIAKPDYGIITNIGTAHIESFGTFEGVLKTKTELYEHLRKVNGIAIYNDKDRVLSEKIFKMVNRAVPYSDPTGIGLIISPEPSDMNLMIRASYHHRTYMIRTNLFGAYNIENVKAAVATGLFLGVEMEDIVNAIEEYNPGNNRSQVKESKNNLLICDSYNANPESMRMALESFSTVRSDKKLCILGDMLELGEKSKEEHLKIIKVLKDNKFKNVMLAGPLFTRVSKGSDFKSFPDTSKLKEFLKNDPVKGYHILIKGSRGMALEQVYELL